MDKTDVSIILNLHREGLYLRPTLRSIDRCVETATQAGISVELICVFDRQDSETRTVFEETQLLSGIQVKVIETDFGSLGPARNAGISIAAGEFVWTADGDDLVSSNSIVQLYNTAKMQLGRRFAIFSEYYIAFGDTYYTAKYFDSQWITAADLAFQHPYVSRLFTSRSTYEYIRYEDLRVADGFAYEDWDFNSRLYAAGYEFRIAPRTAIFYRQRAGSLLRKADAVSSRLTPNNPLFERETFISLMQHSRRRHKSWRAYLQKRKELHNRDFAKEIVSCRLMTEEIVNACIIEPEIDPCLISKTSSYCPIPWDQEHWGFELAAIYKLIADDGFTDIVLIPWLRPGGGEKYILQILHELQQQGLAAKILVIAGQQSEAHEWLDKLPRGAIFIDAYNSFPKLDNKQLIELIARCILSLSAPQARLHLKASEFAHSIMNRFGPALSQNMKPVYYRFCDDTLTFEGKRLHGSWMLRHLREQLRNISVIISDCMYTYKRDVQILGINKTKHHVVYARQDIESCSAVRSAEPTFRLLWASRVCESKRPRLLVAVAQQIYRTFPRLRMAMYGHCEQPYSPKDFKLKNLDFHGSFDNFNELGMHKYDALIYTTAFDGLPNIILEAMGEGLPVIAPDIGGIPEVVVNEVTGYLLPDEVKDKDLIKKYVWAIEQLYNNWDTSLKMQENARNLIRQRHSHMAHTTNVQKAFRED